MASKNNNNDSVKKITAVLDLIDRIKSIKWKELIDVLFKSIIVLGIGGILLCPEVIIKYCMNISERIAMEQHQELIDKRVENTPMINSNLELMAKTLDVDRTFIIEFHNGNNNLAALPFWWGDMTYEYSNKGCFGIRDNWMNISLTRYPFVNHLAECTYWCGNIDEISKVDEGFAKKLNADDADYVAFILLYNSDGKPLGVLGAANMTTDTNVKKDDVIKTLLRFSQLVNPLLIGK